MSETGAMTWPAEWSDPSQKRTGKPRQQGLTMVIDKGLGFHAFEDVMNVSAPYIDVYKLGFGTSALYPPDLLKRKIALARLHHIHIMPGGTFFEVAYMNDAVERYIATVQSFGFNAIEISDGSFPIDKERRWQAIRRAKQAGLVVFSEFGKKTAGFTATLDALLQTLEEDVAAGADYVIVEARESGNVGVFQANGEVVNQSFLQEVQIAAGENASRLIWEAPRKEQQVALLNILGPHVNLGNVATGEVLSVETLRRGLRGDTAPLIFAERRKARCE